VVSELVTNGVRASRAMGRDAVRMWLVSDLRQVVVFVWDASPQPPAQAADPGADAENGRGLLLVEALSDRWGHFGYDGGGKVVWAVAVGTGTPS
jgi:anti-sigma regulatory factor (Ser/Thr protein kinase)